MPTFTKNPNLHIDLLKNQLHIAHTLYARAMKLNNVERQFELHHEINQLHQIIKNKTTTTNT